VRRLDIPEEKMNQLKKILHVEDDPDIQEIAIMVLETLGGFDVRQCDSGPEALAVAPEFRPDLFLLDVMMPEMSGPETLRRLREVPDFSNTPAVFMTAKAQSEEIQAFLDYGAVGVITKPFDPMELTEQILACWKKSFAPA
jgi:two-component system, OmpR family, response regulator